MIHIYEEQGRLLISRRGRLTSVPLEDSKGAVNRMLVRLEQEGRVVRHQSQDMFRQAHHEHLLAQV